MKLFKGIIFAALAVMSTFAQAGPSVDPRTPGPAPEVQCLKDFCVGDTIINDNADLGWIKKIYKDGSCRVNYDTWSPTYQEKLEDLAKRVGATREGYAKGTRIVAADGYSLGTVVMAFSDGRVFVRFDDWAGVYTRWARDLTRAVEPASE